MADTRVQLEVEDWVREHWMQQQFGQNFYRNRLKLSSGGFYVRALRDAQLDGPQRGCDRGALSAQRLPKRQPSG
jgi:hypothetical protein